MKDTEKDLIPLFILGLHLLHLKTKEMFLLQKEIN